MPPELAVPPEEHKYKCSDCGFMKWAEEFTDDKANYDVVCNDCYEQQEFICGVCGDWCDEYTYNEETDVDECNDCKKKENNEDN